MNGNDELGSFLAGVLIASFVFIMFIGSCNDIQFMGDVKKGIKYEDKVYHAVVDSARTDSLHNWRKK